MKLTILGRVLGVVALTATLAGCVDITSEIDILSETTGKATTEITIGPEFYPMIKQMAAAAPKDNPDGFCVKPDDVLTENADGSATCVSVEEGDFSALNNAEGPSEDASFTVVSPGVVRAAFKTEDMSGQITEGQDEQTAAMMKTYLEGHSVTIRIKGKKITDTNMTLAADGKSAELVIPFLDLINGTTKLPPEIYAVVDTN